MATTSDKEIIVAVDGSDASNEAVRWAANAALKRKQPLKLVSAYTMPQFMGSVSSAVVSHADCPVVVVRKDNDVTADNKYGPVVVGVDGSEISRQALKIAFREAEARGALLRAIHSWTDNQIHTSYVGLVDAQNQMDRMIVERQDMMEDELKDLIKEYSSVQVEEIVERERPVQSLTEAAKDAQLLIVGSHGRGGFKGMLLGSTSRTLLQYAPCPMMVVRPKDKKHK